MQASHPTSITPYLFYLLPNWGRLEKIQEWIDEISNSGDRVEVKQASVSTSPPRNSPSRDRCCEVFDPSELIEEKHDDLIKRGYSIGEVPDECKQYGAVCCWRPKWEDFDRCIWHAETYDKSVDQIAQARDDEADIARPNKRTLYKGPDSDTFDTTIDIRLDGAYLRRLELGDEVPLGGCVLIGADLGGSSIGDCYCAQTVFFGARLTRATFTDTNLSGAQFQISDLVESEFNGVRMVHGNLSYSAVNNAIFSDVSFGAKDVNFLHGDARNVEFRDSVVNSCFSGSPLQGASFQDVSLSSSNINNCDLEKSEFIRCNLANVDFRGSDLYQAQFRENQLDDETDFGERCSYEAVSDWNVENHATKYYKQSELIKDISQRDWKSKLWLSIRRLKNRSKRDSVELSKAIYTYRAIQRILQDNYLLEDVSTYFVREQNVRRKIAYSEGHYWQWMKLVIHRGVSNYGESWVRVVVNSLCVILGFGLIYPLIGGVWQSPQSGAFHQMFFELPFRQVIISEPIRVIWINLYFSLVTFTTLGYGDIQPANSVVQALASLQSLIGALLIAYLVVVLSRRRIR
ncbi:pentapeptide repeat-containing protein [Haladaptatus salinisoli]|uniref:pentapeptide repeat-containing protein n=1 Tax=Haladaptatus salinisoli TaxID=2884876 RepID=UPI001D0A27A7|nr:pentapeptide repeat-containing protein [Haladaptatus salinisoli]